MRMGVTTKKLRIYNVDISSKNDEFSLPEIATKIEKPARGPGLGLSPTPMRRLNTIHIYKE